MWGRRSKTEPTLTPEAQLALKRAEHAIAMVTAQDDEVTQLVNRLERRQQQNHFGESLMIAMERRA